MKWTEILFGDTEISFIWEVLLRTFIMFIVVLIVIKLTGKRGVAQLSIFEIVIIISMGSAAGDPMFYHEVGLIPGIVVLLTILVLYRIISYFLNKFEFIEKILEGEVECIIENGKFTDAIKSSNTIAHDEFFAELRFQGIEHLGQIKFAYLETSGKVSVIPFAKDEVKYGLPILPHFHNNKNQSINEFLKHACSECGEVKECLPNEEGNHCGKYSYWVKAIDIKRP